MLQVRWGFQSGLIGIRLDGGSPDLFALTFSGQWAPGPGLHVVSPGNSCRAPRENDGIFRLLLYTSGAVMACAPGPGA